MPTMDYTAVTHAADHRPQHQPFLAAPLAGRDPESYRRIVEAVYQFAHGQMPAGSTRQDLQEALQAAIDQSDREYARERQAELERRIIEQQAAEQARRDRLTERDPYVQVAMEQLKRASRRRP
jgi:hypothetical protein